MGDIKEIGDEVEEINESNEDVSSKLSSDFDTSYDVELEELMFIQLHIHSQGEKQSVCSKNLILKTCILLDSQSTVDVISNGDLLTKIHQVKTTLRIRCNTGENHTFQGSSIRIRIGVVLPRWNCQYFVTEQNQRQVQSHV